MARKHFDDYLNTITKQYIQLNETLKDLSEEVDNNMIEPERLEQLKATIAPVKQSFDTLTYIKYLLDKPTRKSKEQGYNRMNKKVIDSTKHVDRKVVEKRNDDIISNLSNCI